ncbi:MAG: hypothetical protein ACRDJP_16645 [Actinomycetota bacterium]
MRKLRTMLGLAVGIAVMAISTTAGASHTSVAWKGQTWDISDNATAAVDGNDHLTITRTVGTEDARVHVNRLAPTTGTDSFVNANGTPWLMMSYIDNGAHRGVDFFIDSGRPVDDPRLQAGSLFTCQGLGYTRYGLGVLLTEEIVFGEGCDLDGSASPIGDNRAAGQAHTIYVGERPDGTIDYNYDGTWFTSTLLRDNTGPFDFNDVYLRLRGASGTTATFTDLRYGDDHVMAKSDCKDGDWEQYGIFNNQGDCLQWVSAGK